VLRIPNIAETAEELLLQPLCLREVTDDKEDLSREKQRKTGAGKNFRFLVALRQGQAGGDDLDSLL
jgi:hypothetical protein